MTTSPNRETCVISKPRPGRGRSLEGKRGSLVVLIALLFAASDSHVTLRAVAQNSGGTQSSSCNDDKCKVKELIINTGYDPVAQTVLGATSPATVADPFWELVDAPSAIDSSPKDSFPDTPGSTTSLSMPSPAWVIVPNTAWKNLQLSGTPQSGWISAYDVNESLLNNTNNPGPAIPIPPATYMFAPYAFQRCFCTCDGVNSLRIKFDMLVDNIAYIYFDGVEIARNEDTTTGAFTKPFTVDKTFTRVSPGEHCLRIEVRNSSGVALGLNVLGKITTDPPGAPLFLSPACCKPTGKIIGRKIDDRNCNGKNDNNATSQTIEPGLQGWTIVATNTSTGAVITAVTDANGFYYFNNLAPGTYTISEQPQSGWSQTIPGGPATYTVTLAAGQVVQRDFGNCRKETPCVDLTAKEIICKPGNPPTFAATLTVFNNSGSPVSTILLTPPIGSTFTITPQQFNLATPLLPLQSTTLLVTITGATPGQVTCMTATFLDKHTQCICSSEACITMPSCDCAQFIKESVAFGPNGFIWSFTIQNNTPFTFEHMYVLGPITPAGTVITPSYFSISVPPGGQFTGTAIITGAPPGSTVCFDLGFYDHALRTCCVLKKHCLTLPKDNPNLIKR